VKKQNLCVWVFFSTVGLLQDFYLPKKGSCECETNTGMHGCEGPT